jgi:cold shock CspA family protein
MENRLQGKVTKVDKEKGYGFIQSEQMKFTRFHFLWSALLPASKEFLELEVGDRVEFQPLKKDDSGWHALKIRVV